MKRASGSAAAILRSTASSCPPAAVTATASVAQADTRPYRLVVTGGGDTGTAFVLHDGLTIGRSANRAEFVLTDPEVSSLHARIERDGGAPVLIDAGSTNGTFVNDERITSRQLQPGDRVRLGGVQLVVEAAG